MELIIKISKNTYERIISDREDGYLVFNDRDDQVVVVNAIYTGIPLQTGHWIDKGSLSCRCSECGCKSNKETRFCANCGARMEGVKQ